MVLPCPVHSCSGNMSLLRKPLPQTRAPGGPKLGLRPFSAPARRPY